MRRLIYIGCIAALIGYSGAMIWKFERYSRDDNYRDTLAQYNKEAFPLMYFGDSVLTSTGRCDKDLRSIDQMLSGELGINIARIQHGAYSPLVYRHYAGLFKKTKYRPSIVILPINLRAWSPEWADRPLYRFSLTGAWIQLRNGDGVDPIGLFKNLALAKDKNDTVAWAERQVFTSDGRNLGSNGTLSKLVARSVEDCSDKMPSGDDLLILSRRFLWHYATNALGETAMDDALISTIDTLKSQGVQVLAYLTPLNLADGEKAAGSELRVIAEQRLQRVTQLLQKNGIQVLDLHDLVSSEHFIDRAISCEHLDDQGRLAVAHKVGEAARSLTTTRATPP